MGFRQQIFRASDLVRVDPSESFEHLQVPPLSTGDYARLNSGSPRLLVVDADETTLTVAWRDEGGIVCERTLPRPCLYRLS